MLLRASDISRNRLRCDGLGGGSHGKKSVTLLNESIVTKGVLHHKLRYESRDRSLLSQLPESSVNHACHVHLYVLTRMRSAPLNAERKNVMITDFGLPPSHDRHSTTRAICRECWLPITWACSRAYLRPRSSDAQR